MHAYDNTLILKGSAQKHDSLLDKYIEQTANLVLLGYQLVKSIFLIW